MASPLSPAADAFVDVVTTALAHLTRRPEEAVRDLAVAEAANLAAAVIDADERHTDDELWAWIEAFAGRVPTSLARATPADLRRTEIVAGKRSWLDRVSELFDLLVRADARDGTRTAWSYYESAMRLAHVAVSLDLVPSPDELAALDRLRGTLLAAIDAAGAWRPGRPGSGTPAETGRTPPAAAEAGAAPAAVAAAAAELPPARPTEELIAELDALVGLDAVKAEIRTVVALLQVQRLRAERGLPTVETTRHLVFTGNPGTGKTTVARLTAQLYRSIGVVSKGQLVETDRSGLVAGFVGQTAPKTRAKVEEALGGVLLIDEAYSLARGGESDFGKEAVDALVKMMEDHRDDLVVIVTGYTDEMGDFLAMNTGLPSRFSKVVEFPDYTDEQLLAIFTSMGAKQRYHPDDAALAAVRALLAAQPRGKGFGNARLVRNVFEQAVARQAQRIVTIAHPTDDDLTTLTAADVPAAI